MKQISGIGFGRKLVVLLQVPFFNIRKSTRRQYKASVRRMKRQKDYLVREKLAKSFSERRKTGFWSAVKKLRHQSKFRASIVDGVTAPSDIATYLPLT